jgi:glutamate-1-semialdehyde 2,1-aminomutase
MKRSRSKELFDRAQKTIPGGVNSPVRAFKSVGGDPLFMASANGAYLVDADGNRYIDMINSWGPMILGHAHPEIEKAIHESVKTSTSFGAPSEKEVVIAELIVDMVPSIEKVRMVNSGTEATMSAIRVARGYTGKDKIVKFEGHYHGHGDAFLISAGSGAMTMGTPDSPGVTRGTAQDTLLARFNDLDHVREVLEQNEGDVAAIIVEPVAGNMGCVPPEPGFLEGLRHLCNQQDLILIFDEVMTGFRLARGGAQERYGVTPDMTTLGKIIGGGMPVGAYGGKKEIMDYVSPQGPVYQAGTLSGNPVAMAAGYAQLTYLSHHPEVYTYLDEVTERIVQGLKAHTGDYSLRQVGGMYSLFFTPERVTNFDTAVKCDTERFGMYFREMLKRGVYLAPSQFESLFISTAIGDQEVRHILTAHEEVMHLLTTSMANP